MTNHGPQENAARRIEASLEATIGPEDAGRRLDLALARALPALSRSRIKALIGAGRVSRGGATIDEADYRVKPGERFTVAVPPPQSARPEAQTMPLTIVYEDAALVVLDKPAGLVVHPAPGNPDRTLVNALIAHCGASLQGIGGELRPGIVHRLDKDTSGLMVVAKTEAAHRALAAAFAERRIARRYKALVWGVPAPPQGEITGNIGRSPRNRKKMAVVTRGGKPAITRYGVVRPVGPAASLVECRLLTGRTHQIRVHLAEIGHPVIGDPIYGRAGARRLKPLNPKARTAVAAFRRQALHADLIGFSHPVTGEHLQFDSVLPQDIEWLIGILESV
jgi:23S rRNA pseudouridine1911/1915/1917 synthase